MTEFVQLWVYLSSSPLFGLTATLVTHQIATAAYERLDRTPWANLVLWSVLCLGAVLMITGMPYRAGSARLNTQRPEVSGLAAV